MKLVVVLHSAWHGLLQYIWMPSPVVPLFSYSLQQHEKPLKIVNKLVDSFHVLLFTRGLFHSLIVHPSQSYITCKGLFWKEKVNVYIQELKPYWVPWI